MVEFVICINDCISEAYLNIYSLPIKDLLCRNFYTGCRENARRGVKSDQSNFSCPFENPGDTPAIKWYINERVNYLIV